MERIGDMLWDPWLVYLAIGFAAAATVWNRLPQLRGWASFLRGRPRSAGMTSRVAVAAGVGGLWGTATAIATGGPGALFWLVLMVVLGLAVHGAEALLATAPRRPAEDGSVPDGATGLAMVARRGHRRAIAATVGITTLFGSLVVGGLLQVHQGAQILHATFSVMPIAAGVSLAVLLGVVVAFPRWRRHLLELSPWVLGLYFLACVTWLGQDTWGIAWALEQVWTHAFQLRPAAAGFVGSILTVVVAQGIWAGTLATQTGLGVSAMAVTDPNRTHPPASSPHAVMLGALIGGGMAVATALIVLIDPSPEDSVIEERITLPLERPSSRGLRPNPDVGQVIVLPEDAGFEDGKSYAMVLRSNPRGHAWPSRLITEDNVIHLPRLGILETVETVVFRPKDQALAQNPAWDIRVAVRPSTETINGKEVLRLDPIGDDVSFEALIERYELSSQPFVVVDDFMFTGKVGYATADGLGRHLGMFEERPSDAPRNPNLHEFFRNGYRGPYVASDGPRPPWAMVASDDLQATAGTVLPLAMKSPPRGADLLHVTADGKLMAPPWDFVGDANTVVLRHGEDSSLDRFIAVQPRFDGRRWLFDPPSWMDDWTMVAKLPDYSGPFLLSDPFRFDVEVRSGERFPGDHGDQHQALIPLTAETEPAGPTGELPYTPHPGEILATDMEGPVVRREGVGAVVARFADRWGAPGGQLMAILAVALAVLGAAAWSEFGARAWDFLSRARARWAYFVLFVSGCAGAASLADEHLFSAVRLAVGLLLVPNLLVLFISFATSSDR